MYNSDMTEKLVNVFKDTENWYSTDPGLQKAFRSLEGPGILQPQRMLQRQILTCEKS